jgi:hypothetical protein
MPVARRVQAARSSHVAAVPIRDTVETLLSHRINQTFDLIA